MATGDLDGVLAIETASFTTPWTRATFRSLLARNGTGLWVAEARASGSEEAGAAEIVGYAVVWAVVDQAELGNVAVAASFRRRGVASRLVETVLEWLRGEGVREVFLEVRESNVGARALYASHGFEAVGRRKGYYSRPREDALVLRLALGRLTD